jgi:TonB family protein
MARQLKIVGKVELEVVVDVDGHVADVKVIAGNPVLTKPCVKAVSEWKFQPFRSEGKPARAVTSMSFEFK